VVLVISLIGAAAVALALVAQTGVSELAVVEAAFPGFSGHVVFESDRDGDMEIYSMLPDGSNVVQLTTNTAQDRFAGVSADGSQVVFSSDRDGNMEIYTMAIDGSGQTRITSDAGSDESPAWSPEGTRIAFNSDRDGDMEIHTMDADGSNVTQLTTNGVADAAPAWSPNGESIVFQQNIGSGGEQIFVMDADGGNQTQLTSNACQDVGPDWSPDGAQIAFGRDCFGAGQAEIFVMDADGSNQTNVSNHSAYESPGAWSPDGAQIVFASNRDSNFEVYRMEADGSSQSRLTTSGGFDGADDWQPHAVARVISDPEDFIEGDLSRGQIGDYYLANDKIQVVIQRPIRNLISIGQYGGQIIDADLMRVAGDPERDNFEEWSFGVNIENTAHYTSVSVINDGSNGQPAVIRAEGVDDLLDFINPSTQAQGFGFTIPAPFDDVDLPVSIRTDYILAQGDDYVTVETTVTNLSSTETVETFFLDFLNGSGDVEVFAPGYGFGEVLITSACPRCNFLAWLGEDDADGVAYAVVHDIPDTTTFSTSGVSINVLGINAIAALLGANPNFDIDPLDSATVTRYFAVGEDIGDIVDTRNEIVGYSTGTISGTLTRSGSPVEGADVVVLGNPGDGPGSTKNVIAHYHTDADGNYGGTLPSGSYTVEANVDGHLDPTPNPGSVAITAGNTTVQDFTIAESGRVQVDIIDENSAAIAGKVSLIGFDPNPDPGNVHGALVSGVFQDVTADRLPYGVARIEYVDHSGSSDEFFVEPGDYRLVVSHGTEYSVYEQDITVTAGALTSVSAQIARVIDTTGYVSGDFHVHQLDSPDSEVSYRERIVSMLAEGVDWFTPSDHEHRSDLQPTIEALGADSLISVGVSNENTTPDYGHFNAWPVDIDHSQPNNGALDWGKSAPAGQDFPSYGNYMMPPAEIFATLLADPGVDTVQVNHIDSFFGPGGLAIDTAYEPPQDFQDNASRRLDPAIANLFDDSFTALESWQGTDRNDMLSRFIGRNLGDWFNLLNQGILRFSVADSDTHVLYRSQSGFPRTYIPSPTDDPSAIGAIADTMAGYVNEGRATGSNGPFITVTSSAASTSESGGLDLGLPTLIESTDGSATIQVDIQSPLWAEFDRVEYYVGTVPTIDDFDDDPLTPPYYNVAPQVIHDAGTDFTITEVDDFPAIPGAKHLEATTSATLTGLTEDTWVVVLVRGTDGVSKPIFPVVPNDLQQSVNPTLADLIDGNLGELGVTALAFANPLFISVDGNDQYDHPEVDSDGDGCTNAQEVGPDEMQGGQRSPSNPNDFFDPTGEKQHRLNDVLATIQQYFEDEFLPPPAPPNTPNPNYNPDTDRTALGPDPWDLGPPNGTQRLDDILAAIGQYFHDCA
jgi:hypothetical protein